VDPAEAAKAADLSARIFQADGDWARCSDGPTDPAEVGEVGAAVGIPTLVGITPESMASSAAALIAGSSVKEDGLWPNRLDERRVRAGARSSDYRRDVVSGQVPAADRRIAFR
jgi:hypothetical protein